MIVWVNAAFGGGKTTLVSELHRRRPDALVYDPEQIGYVLREIVPVPNGNFQNLRLWRRQVVSMATGLLEEYGQPVLAPMTLVNPQYVAEIFGALADAGVTVHHFFLKVTREELVRRIDARVIVPDDPEREAAVRQWCKDQIDECLAAADTLPADTVFLDGERPTPDLADEVLARIGTRPAA